jgi:uncharacterized Ntn-hydrolase superfamily protein
MERREFLKQVGLAGAVAAAGTSRLSLRAAEEWSSPAKARRLRSPLRGLRRADTFSICAVDPEKGEAGVAVASRCLSVGALVCYAEPGVGAVATQATVNPDYGPQGLALLRKGVPAQQVVERLVAGDVTVTADEPALVERYKGENLNEENVDFFRPAGGGRIIWMTSRMRQLGVVDRSGKAATHNGARIMPWAGSVTGPGFCCQGNLLAGEAVVKSMAKAFEDARRGGQPLVAALMATLVAGDSAGGDKRGKQAAAMLVVRDRGHWSGSDRWCDVRVDDHPEPVAELARTLRKNRFIK